MSKGPVELVVGVLAYRTGVEQHEVGLLDLVGPAIAHGLEQAGSPFRVVDVHLASEGADGVGAAHDNIPRLCCDGSSTGCDGGSCLTVEVIVRVRTRGCNGPG